MMMAIAATGGLVQINFCPGFIDPDFPPVDADVLKRWVDNGGLYTGPITDHVTPLSLLADHFDHAIEVIGPEHVGIGSDFDGIPQLPQGLEDCSKLPHLTAELLRRGHTEEDLTKVLGENVLEVMDACARAARKLEQGPEATYSDTPGHDHD
jgi:membrane dipeptidase